MLEWTGERYLPWLTGAGTQIHYEHLHRYAFAAQFAVNKRVLDLGCGEGYGTFILAEQAIEAVGLDIDSAAIRHAQNTYYIRSNVSFVQGSATDVPLDDKFDVITCFEMLEHIKDQEGLLREVRRLLAPGGLFIVSTPNKLAYSDASGYCNPYHVRELYYNDFNQLLRSAFGCSVVLGQRNHVGSFLWSIGDKSPVAGAEVLVRKELEGFRIANGECKRPLYFIGIASDQKLPDAVYAGSSLLDISKGFVEELSEESASGVRLIDGSAKHTPAVEGDGLKEAQMKAEEELRAERARLDAEIAALKEAQMKAEEELRAERARLDAEAEALKEAQTKAEEELRLQGSVQRLEFQQESASMEAERSRLDRERSRLQQHLSMALSQQAEQDQAESQWEEEQARFARETEMYKSTIRGQREELDLIYSSFSWKIVRGYRKLFDRILGGDTGRRRLYLRLLARFKGRGGADLGIAKSTLDNGLDAHAQKPGKDHFYWTYARYEALETLPSTEGVDIIICFGGDAESLERCVASIERNTAEMHRIHVVTHVDHLSRMSESVRRSVVIVSHSMNTFNFAAANNGVLSKCDGDVILLNDDTEVTPGWLTLLRNDSKGVALTGAHTGYQCSGNPDMWGEGAARLTWYPINMFCAFIPRRVRQVVGLLDEEYCYYGGEDVDYSCRALKNGIPLVISSAYVHHVGSQSFGERKTRLMAEADKITKEKHGVESPFELSGMRPLVSVIIATHNRASLLTRAARSILDGLFRNVELIIVDDQSADDSWKIITELQKQDVRVVGIRLGQNLGCVGARQTGFQASKGQYVAFMDDDDLAHVNRVSAPLMQFLARPELDVVYCGWDVVSEQGKLSGRLAPFDLEDYLAMKFDIGSGALLVRRRIIEDVPFMSLYDRAIDFDWVFRVVRRGFRIDYCPAVVLDYNRMGPGEAHLSGNSEAAKAHWAIQEREYLLRGAESGNLSE